MDLKTIRRYMRTRFRDFLDIYIYRRKYGNFLIKRIEDLFANEIIRSLPVNVKILEVGCGNSAWANGWVSRGRDVVPMDIVRCGDQVLPYVRADVRFSPFKDSAFDVVCCICTIEHIGVAGCPIQKGAREDLKAIDEMKRVLKNGGLLILTTAIGWHFFDPDFAQRNYPRNRLDLLIRGWNKVREELYANFGKEWNKKTWRRSDWTEILSLPERLGTDLKDWYGTSCLLLQKVER